jgi:hypothetical protein
MDYYNTLKELAKNGHLEILYIVSPPRTLSTILEICLSEYGDGQIHEPFHKRRRLDFNDGCRIIYERYLYLSDKLNKKHIKLVIKDLSKFVKLDEWQMLLEISNRFVFTVREPSRQIFSVASRYANDLDNYDVDNLSYEQILSNLDRIPFEDLADKYWRNLQYLFDATVEHLNSRVGKNKCVAIVSGITFRHDVADSITKLLLQLNIKLALDKFIGNWSVGSSKNFYRPEYIINNTDKDKDFRNGAWLGSALNSTEFNKLNLEDDSPVDIGIYDKKLQNYFLTDILPVYVDMYFNKYNVCKPSIEFVFGHAFENSDLFRINPIESLLLNNSFTPISESQKIIKESNDIRLKQIIEEKYPCIYNNLVNLI